MEPGSISGPSDSTSHIETVLVAMTGCKCTDSAKEAVWEETANWEVRDTVMDRVDVS